MIAGTCAFSLSCALMGKIFAAELFQRGAVNILVNDLVQPFPKAQGLALSAVGAAFCGSGKAGNGDNLALHRAQDIARSDLGGRAAEPVAALAAAAAAALGCCLPLGEVLRLGDAMNGLMALPNLAALFLLRREVAVEK